MRFRNGEPLITHLLGSDFLIVARSNLLCNEGVAARSWVVNGRSFVLSILESDVRAAGQLEFVLKQFDNGFDGRGIGKLTISVSEVQPGLS